MSQTDNNTENFEKNFISILFASYFENRDCLPQDGYIEENKTTQQIQDELQTMCPVKHEHIAEYMTFHGYTMTTAPDGTVAWAIWRQLER